MDDLSVVVRQGGPFVDDLAAARARDLACSGYRGLSSLDFARAAQMRLGGQRLGYLPWRCLNCGSATGVATIKGNGWKVGPISIGIGRV